MTFFFRLFDQSIPIVALAALITGGMRLETTVLWFQSAWTNVRGCMPHAQSVLNGMVVTLLVTSDMHEMHEFVRTRASFVLPFFLGLAKAVI